MIIHKNKVAKQTCIGIKMTNSNLNYIHQKEILYVSDTAQVLTNFEWLSLVDLLQLKER